MPCFLAALWSSTAPFITPWSVSPIAGWPKLAARWASFSILQAPSSSEYSEWTWRCAQPGGVTDIPGYETRRTASRPVFALTGRGLGSVQEDPARPGAPWTEPGAARIPKGIRMYFRGFVWRSGDVSTAALGVAGFLDRPLVHRIGAAAGVALHDLAAL